MNNTEQEGKNDEGSGHSNGGHVKEFTIIVNGREKKVANQVLTFQQVLALAYPTPPTGQNVEITITYRKADSEPHDGNLIPGATVKVRNGTVFNVTATDKS